MAEDLDAYLRSSECVRVDLQSASGDVEVVLAKLVQGWDRDVLSILRLVPPRERSRADDWSEPGRRPARVAA
jgi:hypothetical protein